MPSDDWWDRDDPRDDRSPDDLVPDEEVPRRYVTQGQGIPSDAQRMGLDRNTEEGALIAMAGSLDSAKPLHRWVAWVLLAAFALPLALTVLHQLF